MSGTGLSILFYKSEFILLLLQAIKTTVREVNKINSLIIIIQYIPNMVEYKYE
jgi:hypothetical protein